MKEKLAHFTKAWRLRSVKLGFLGTLLIVIGSLTPAYLPQRSPVWIFLNLIHFTGTWAKIVGTILVITGLLVLINAWLHLKPKKVNEDSETVGDQIKHWAVLTIWGLPFLFAPPIFSHDAYSYAAQGWLLHNNIDPYSAGPGLLPGVFADQVSWVWRNTPAPYGPLSLLISERMVELCRFDPFWSSLAMRLPALVGVILIVLLLPKIAKMLHINPVNAAWWSTMNPLLIIDFLGGAHNDSLMMGLGVLGIWVTERFKKYPQGSSKLSVALRPWLSLLAGAAIVGVGATIKQPALLVAVALPFLSKKWVSWEIRSIFSAAGRILVSIGVAVGIFSLISVVSGLEFGWIYAVSVPGMVITLAPFTILGVGAQHLLSVLGWAPPMPGGYLLEPDAANYGITSFRIAGFMFSAVSIVYLMITKLPRRPMYFLCWGYFLFVLGAPAVHSWYLLWGMLLLPLARPSERVYRFAVLITIGLLCYAAIDFSYRNGLITIAPALVIPVIWAINRHHLLEKAENR